ncbi:MAG TPA: hypothetical protein VNG90_04960 [Candidatus Acidoferrum sp.]|nr:hypothetical protein [Candidatus Acidoferrum sp.]
MANDPIPELPEDLLEILSQGMSEVEKSMGAIVLLKANIISAITNQITAVTEALLILEVVFGKQHPVPEYLAVARRALVNQLLVATQQELSFEDIAETFEQISANWSKILPILEYLHASFKKE